MARANSVASMAFAGRRLNVTKAPLPRAAPFAFRPQTSTSAILVSADQDWSMPRAAARPITTTSSYPALNSLRTPVQLMPCTAVSGSTKATLPSRLAMRSATATNADAIPAAP